MTTTRRSLDIAARAVLAKRTEAILRGTGAVEDRHIQAPDGRHLGARIDGLRVVVDPVALGELCGFWARRYRDPSGEASVDVVVGPVPAGLVVAVETARQLGIRAALATAAAAPPAPPTEPGPRSEPAILPALPPDARVLVVDVVLDRVALESTIGAAERAGAEVVGCAVVVAGSAERPVVASPSSGRRYEVVALWQPDTGPWDPGSDPCPACAAGRPLDA